MPDAQWTTEAGKWSRGLLRNPLREVRGVLRSDHPSVSVVFAPHAEFERIHNAFDKAGIEILSHAHAGPSANGTRLFVMLVRYTHVPTLEEIVLLPDAG